MVISTHPESRIVRYVYHAMAEIDAGVATSVHILNGMTVLDPLSNAYKDLKMLDHLLTQAAKRVEASL